MKFLLSKPANLIGFNLIWLASVIGRYELAWIVVPAVLLYIALLVCSGTVKAYQIVLPALVGIGVDTILTLIGVFQFDSEARMLPLWLIVLWFAFATTLTQSLQVVGRYLWVACIAGAVAVPLNYFVGERLGAVSFGYDLVFTMTVLSLVWGLLLPLLFYLADASRWRADVIA